MAMTIDLGKTPINVAAYIRRIPLSAVKLIEKIVQNIIRHPKNPRFRDISASAALKALFSPDNLLPWILLRHHGFDLTNAAGTSIHTLHRLKVEKGQRLAKAQREVRYHVQASAVEEEGEVGHSGDVAMPDAENVDVPLCDLILEYTARLRYVTARSDAVYQLEVFVEKLQFEARARSLQVYDMIQKVRTEKSLKMLHRILTNVVTKPTVMKFRKINASAVSDQSVVDVLRGAGWKPQGKFLMCPLDQGQSLRTATEILRIEIDARDAARREAEIARRKALPELPKALLALVKRVVLDRTRCEFLLSPILRNILSHPTTVKFRVLSPKKRILRMQVYNSPDVIALLRGCGFVRNGALDEDLEDCGIHLPVSTSLQTTQDVVAVLRAEMENRVAEMEAEGKVPDFNARFDRAAKKSREIAIQTKKKMFGSPKEYDRMIKKMIKKRQDEKKGDDDY